MKGESEHQEEATSYVKTILPMQTFAQRNSIKSSSPQFRTKLWRQWFREETGPNNQQKFCLSPKGKPSSCSPLAGMKSKTIFTCSSSLSHKDTDKRYDFEPHFHSNALVIGSLRLRVGCLTRSKSKVAKQPIFCLSFSAVFRPLSRKIQISVLISLAKHLTESKRINLPNSFIVFYLNSNTFQAILEVRTIKMTIQSFFNKI